MIWEHLHEYHCFPKSNEPVLTPDLFWDLIPWARVLKQLNPVLWHPDQTGHLYYCFAEGPVPNTARRFPWGLVKLAHIHFEMVEDMNTITKEVCLTEILLFPSNIFPLCPHSGLGFSVCIEEDEVVTVIKTKRIWPLLFWYIRLACLYCGGWKEVMLNPVTFPR